VTLTDIDRGAIAPGESERNMTAQTLKRVAVVAVGVLALASCSKASDAGIAHLSTSSNPTASASPSTKNSEAQALAFAKCMRDNGVDFPDPTVDANGNLSFAGAFRQAQSGGLNPSNTTFQSAMTACRTLMNGLSLGGGRAGGAFDSTAIQAAMLTYTTCLRTQGLNVGDITFNGPGLRGAGSGTGSTSGSTSGSNAQPTVRPSDGPPAGVAQDGGDPTSRFARILGQDPTDPAWIAANKVCGPALTTAMSSASSGATSTNGSTSTNGKG
jgi:hypothetical protein